MAIWYYYNELGEKIKTESAAELKKLVAEGIIFPNTIIENETGKSCKAEKVKGLVFSESVKTENPNKDIYTQESITPQPTIVPVPPIVSTTITKTKNEGNK
ncbi:MAG: hypothetical protein LBI18_15595, partial [Planctomycetaceae bacterium]|nr:hypothetical protein [Planctomycetaceae bacterium]